MCLKNQGVKKTRVIKNNPEFKMYNSRIIKILKVSYRNTAIIFPYFLFISHFEVRMQGDVAISRDQKRVSVRSQSIWFDDFLQTNYQNEINFQTVRSALN